MTIYLVEDSETDAIMIRDGLKAAGLKTSHFPLAASFLDHVRMLNPGEAGNHLLILDIVMPRQDGLEVLKALRDLKFLIPTIVISAHDQDYLATADNLGSAWGMPIVGTFRKPVSLNAFTETVLRQVKP